MNLQTQEEVIQAMADQALANPAFGERLNAAIDARAEERFKDVLKNLKDDDPIVKKMIGWGRPDRRLLGSKFSRFGGWTTSDVEFCYDLMNAHRGKPIFGGTHPGPSPELEAAFKAMSDAYYLPEEEVRAIDKTALDNTWPRVPTPEARARFGSVKRYQRARHVVYGAVDAPEPEAPNPYALGTRAATMDTTQSGFGTQLVGVQYVGDLWDAAFQDAVIAPLFPTFEMTAPTAQYPVVVDMPEMMLFPESTSDILATAQYPTVRTGSNRVTITAKKLGFHQVFSNEMEEDSIIQFIPFLQRQLARALAFYTDNLLLNGDTTTAGTGNLNSDDAAPAATKWYLAFDGIKKQGLLDNTANALPIAGAIALTVFRDLKNAMRDLTRFVDWGRPNDPSRLIFVCDPQTAYNAALIDEVLQAKIMLADRAEFLSGQVMSIFGSPVIGHMALTRTDTDGKYTTVSPGTADTKGQVVAFNPDGGTIGWRRRVRLMTEPIVGSDQTRIAAYLRLGFGRYTPTGAASGGFWSAVAYDIT